MAEIAPFVGIRYDPSRVGDLSKVVSPPYDVISPDDRVYYHHLHANNFVRLVLGEEFENDDDSNNRFTRARRYLDEWLEQGVLKPDDLPAIYVYEQQFELDGPRRVRGFTCAVKLHDYADGVILPHENTLAKPKSQLSVLMRETQANLDSIYSLYADEGRELNEVMDRAAASKPVAEALDKNGVRHSLWAVTDLAEIARVVDFLKDRPIAIADGHHRYETSLAHAKEARMQAGNPAEELPSDWTMMTLVNVFSRDMTIYPTHRVAGSVPEDAMAGLDAALGEHFEVIESTPGRLLANMSRLGAIGLYRPGRAVVLKPKPSAWNSIAGSEASRKLELNVLHKVILEPLLGIDENKLRNQSHIVYTRDPSEAIGLVDSGERQAAFLLNHIAVRSVLDVAAAGEKMPQKATYFYPKLLSGLVMRRLR